jgi:hypothetical protein
MAKKNSINASGNRVRDLRLVAKCLSQLRHPVRTYVHTYIHTYIHTYMHMYTYITYIHTHTHTHSAYVLGVVRRSPLIVDI